MDRITFKFNVSEEEKQKMQLKMEKKQSEIAYAVMERNKLEGILREKDAMIQTLNT